jgi:tRNA(fMet)-specific endonuclease VapC
VKYLLDSNIIIRMTMASGDILRARIADCDDGDLVTSAIALAEVVYGSARSKPPALDQLRAFLEEVPVLDFDLKAAFAYASLPFRPASYDRLIAAHALSQGLVVVTDNVLPFADAPGLKVENWTI